jgi:hypothetical protein
MVAKESSEKKKSGFDGDKLLFDEDKEDSKKKNPIHDDEEIEEEIEEETAKQHAKHSKTKKFIQKDDDSITIKIPKLKGFMLERLVYWVLIVFLIIIIFSSNSININLGREKQNVIEGNVSLEANVEVNESAVIIEEEDLWGIIDNECVEVDSNFSITYSTEEECLTNIVQEIVCESKPVEVKILEINLNKDFNNKIDNVIIEIINNYNISLDRFYIELTSTNSEYGALFMFKDTFTNRNIQGCGGIQGIVLNNLSPSFVTTRDKDNLFNLRVYDYNNNTKEIASTTKTLRKI